MILTLKELAEHLKVNERTILRMLKCNQIEGKKIGGQWRFNGSQIDQVFFPADTKETDESVPLNDLTHSQIGIPVSRMLDPSRIIMDLHSTDRDSVIEELTSPKIFNDLVLDTRDLQEKCLARENLCSTAVGKNIAIPHPRDPIATLQLPACIVYGYSKKGINFNAPDGKPVHMFFLICSQNIELHLHLMGSLANILNNDTFVNSCRNATTPENIISAALELERNDFLRKSATPSEDYE